MTQLDVERPDWVATYNDFTSYWMWDFGKEYEGTINGLLSRCWPRVQLALNSSGQGECNKAAGMNTFLNELHCIIAGVMLNIPAVRLSVEQRAMYNDMVTSQLTQLADGTLRVCEGVTASSVPFSGRVVRND